MPGGVAATLGLISPSIVIILVIARMLKRFQNSPLVQRGFYGLRPASIALVAAAGMSVFKVTMLDLPAFAASGSPGDLFVWKALALGVFLFWAQRKFKKIHPIAFIAFAGLVGAVFSF